ncbi:thioesterase II family protein [Paenibacillus sp. L3-i20]|uniref:thioesterase II family protein n=1 Tax=Paenibacillus sp. L3-i20 TaxID=2905833 RepID=UPI001EE02BAC|nr:thioesterase domain-containing protein [Paenibacillus sp. L3-i20]
MNKLKLFTFPFAGGSSLYYYKWKKQLSSCIELKTIELAGRGNRLKAPFYETFHDAVEDLYELMINEVQDDAPFAFFGHSMGCLLSYELAHMLKERSNKEPKVMFMSGRWAPHIERDGMVDSSFPDVQLKARLLELGGTTAELFENQQMVEAFIPILRSDFLLMETYTYNENREPLTAAINVVTGNKDYDVNQRDLIEWQTHTTGEFSIHKFKGGHFYINDSFDSLLQHINRTLEGYIPAKDISEKI